MSMSSPLRARGGFACIVIAAMSVAGCGGKLSSPSELAAFCRAAPSTSKTDQSSAVLAGPPSTPYRVGTDDVLKVRLANVLEPKAETWRGENTLLCRVDTRGQIVLPLVGAMHVADDTIVEIEAALAAAYYPRYVIRRPNVHVTVEEYHTYAVSVTGAVERPGVYDLRRDQMTLISALMAAGGVTEQGAKAIRIDRSRAAGRAQAEETLPISWSGAPNSDFTLNAGDRIEVEGLGMQHFMVIGLVKDPGAFPYLPGQQYTLAQAIAFAGGLDDVASPPYARIYRNTPEGSVATATLPIEGKSATDAGTLPIRPGDIIAVEHTFGTRMRLFISRMFRGGLLVGANYDMAR